MFYLVPFIFLRINKINITVDMTFSDFSDFTRSISGLEITFGNNSVPITYVNSIMYYRDDHSGLFSKKEFRWSFDNSYWSSWETLTPSNLTRIVTYPNKYFYLEIRYEDICNNPEEELKRIEQFLGLKNYKSLKFLKERTLIVKKYKCTVCGYVYDPAVGDPDNGVAPGTAFEDIPDTWVCPECGVSKEDFEVVE